MQCRICLVDKTSEYFRLGHLQCRKCSNEKLKKTPINREKRNAYMRGYMKKHYKGYTEKRRENARKYRLKHKKQISEYQKKYLFLNREKTRQYSKKRRLKDRIKERAREILKQAVKSGKLKRGICKNCGSNEKTHGHHPDYSKPLNIIWLCPPCHINHHAELKAKML